MLQLWDDAADEKIISFDYAEYQNDEMSLWIKDPDLSGATLVGTVSMQDGKVGVTVGDDPEPRPRVCEGRVSIIGFGDRWSGRQAVIPHG